MLNCNSKYVTLENSRREKLEWEGVDKPKQSKMIFSIWSSKLLEKGCLTYFSHIRDV